jgi:hypothetical protein
MSPVLRATRLFPESSKRKLVQESGTPPFTFANGFGHEAFFSVSKLCFS